MKKMMCLMVLAILLYAQPSIAQFGVQAGFVGVPGEAFPTADQQDKLGGASGFTIGILYEHRLNEKWVFQPGLNLLNKGWKDELFIDGEGDETVTTKMKINYLEIPLLMLYKPVMEKGFYVGAGPEILFGMSGKYSTKSDGGSSSEKDYKFGSGANQEKPMTIGLNALVGYQWKNFQLSVNYGMGITNRNPPANMDYGNQSHFAARVGYLFNK